MTPVRDDDGAPSAREIKVAQWLEAHARSPSNLSDLDPPSGSPPTRRAAAVILAAMNARFDNNWWWLRQKERAAG